MRFRAKHALSEADVPFARIKREGARVYCETLQADLFARHHALCVLIAAGRTESLFCFIFFCPARGNPVATARGTKG